MTAFDAATRVHFIHGLEGSPHGSKAVFLAEHFDTETPVMDTSDFAACVAAQRQAIERRVPEVVVGSSFGGAVAVRLLQVGAWRGPTVLLAQAAVHFGVEERLPDDVPVIVVHGTEDDVVDIEGSRRLARTGTPGRVRLVEVPDGHRLESLVASGRLAELVREARSL